jgi:8-oxo-dGTP diphosphatase
LFIKNQQLIAMKNKSYSLFKYLNCEIDDSQEQSSEVLGLAEVKRLYDITDWKIILLEEEIRQSYNGFPAIAFFKAFALPFLINIPTERALRRELYEREALQTLCGFSRGDQIPTRNTFWHFRNRYQAYPDLMIRILISMVLSGKRPNLDLPFVQPSSESSSPPEGIHSEVELDEYRPKIEIWKRCRRESDSNINRSRKKDMTYNLQLPVEVKTELSNGGFLTFKIVRPAWIIIQGKQKDTLLNMGPSSKVPYTSCNVIVLRMHEGIRQILLSQRLAGYGTGEYALPGGKQLPSETLKECAERELYEETRIRILRARPVSMQKTSYPGKPWVLSVGVLAEEYIGKPTTVEPNQHRNWEWFDLDNLPKPLFGPSKIAIRQYLDGIFCNLQWKDIEAQKAEGSTQSHDANESYKAEQLKLF